ncbi:hypothetical protein TorRG33x02_088470 [Trema orientale]|uniref:Uncharacterized protein n=1 Tax=Trema orientale TaxID=63057 RepID=A0A2P5FC25_TREOI|nr:hypothetical protein TorRG33x02_088470 [Trema orientale]
MANAGRDHVAIDVETLASNIAYTPNAFSFGPFHHDNEQLKPTKRIKQKYLLGLISRLSKPDPIDPNPTHIILPDSKLVTDFTKAISDVQEEALEYYAGPIGMEADKFIEMLVLDGCFIIELFRKKSYLDLIEKTDPVFTMSCLLQFLYHDLILLENQVPWLVLETLFHLTKTTSIDTKPLVELAIDFFGNIFSTIPTPLVSTTPNHGSKHILDLLSNSLVSNSSVTIERSFPWEVPMPSATRLRDSGIKFEVNNLSQSILDIRFHSKAGVMKIPTLLIQETAETVFRNLISLEQCCPNYEPIVTSYAVLLDNLIDTNRDIQILCKTRAIVNWLNIDDATRFFNRLYIDTYVKVNYYHQLTTEVNKFCGSRWHKYRRVLKRDYFKHPWALISFIAASIGLTLTIIETLFGIIK